VIPSLIPAKALLMGIITGLFVQSLQNALKSMTPIPPVLIRSPPVDDGFVDFTFKTEAGLEQPPYTGS
jgi:hypothetical protein